MGKLVGIGLKGRDPVGTQPRAKLRSPTVAGYRREHEGRERWKMRVGEIKRINGVLFLQSHVCLVRYKGEDKIHSFPGKPHEIYRTEYADTEEQLMWKKLEKLIQ